MQNFNKESPAACKDCSGDMLEDAACPRLFRCEECGHVVFVEVRKRYQSLRDALLQAGH